MCSNFLDDVKDFEVCGFTKNKNLYSFSIFIDQNSDCFDVPYHIEDEAMHCKCGIRIVKNGQSTLLPINLIECINYCEFVKCILKLIESKSNLETRL